MRNFYVFVLMLLIGAWANVTQVAAQNAAPAGNMWCHIKYGDLYLTLKGEGTGDEADRLLILTNTPSEKSLWRLEKNGDVSGSFIVRSVYCNASLGIQQPGKALVTENGGDYAYTFAESETIPGHYSILSEHSVDWDESLNGQYFMSGSGKVADDGVVGSTTADAGWTLVEHTIFKIKNRALNKYLFQEVDNKNITFVNDGGDNTKYYYKVTFDGNQATIINSNGKPLARGGGNNSYANAVAVTVSPVSMEHKGNGYFLFPGTHSTAQDVFTKNGNTGGTNYDEYDTENNPYFLTTWTQTTEAANQYTFEPVTIPKNDVIYTVQFDGLQGIEGDDALTVTYANDNYAGNKVASNGGFYVLSTSPSATDFIASAESDDYGAGEVTIDTENRLVKVSFTAKKAKLTLQITMDGVEYHKVSVEVPLNTAYAYSALFGYYQWLLNSNATLTVNGEKKSIVDVFGESGNITPTGNAIYTFALKTSDILSGVQPSDMTTEDGLKDGDLYQISSAITKILESGRGGKKIYGKPGTIYTKAVDGLDSETFLVMAHSLWKIVYTDESQKYFKIYNQVMGQYMGPVANNTTEVVFTDAAGAGVYKLIPTSALHKNVQNTSADMTEAMYSGPLFKIAAADAEVQIGDQKKLHIKANANTLIGYDQDEIWSKWYFTKSDATSAKVFYVKSIESRLLDQTRITPSTMVDMSKMHYSTNAQENNTNGDGTLVDSGCLCDNDPLTFFHSRYSDTGYDSSSPNPDVHWLQVDLGENHGMSSFSFHTKKRSGNNNNRPTEIEVQASANENDGFTILYTLYSIPTVNDDFYSPSYPLGEGMRYLRFVVKATNSGTKFFTYSEFHIHTTKGVLPSALAETSLKAGKAAIDAVCQPYDNRPGHYQGISEALYEARDNAFAYESAFNSLKAKVEKLIHVGEDVHEYRPRTGTVDEAKAKLQELGECTADNEKLSTAENCATWAAQLPDADFNIPQAGEVYLLKSASNGKYAATETKTVSQATSSSLDAMDEDYANEKKFLLQYTEDGKLKSVIDGSELILKNLNTYTFSEHPRYPNTYLVASPDRYMYAGDDALNFNGISEAGYAPQQTSWQLEHVKSYPVTLRQVSEGKNWATFYTDKAVYLPNGMKARYVDNTTANPVETATGSNVFKLTYTDIASDDNILPANTGVLLVNEATGEFRLCESRVTSASSAPEANAFVGRATEEETITPVVGNEAYYALGKPAGDYAPGFYLYSGSKFPVNKAFLKMNLTTGDNAAYGFIFADDDDATGIQDIQPATVGEENGVCYDLTGKRVVNPTRPGIYIKSGKKLVIK